MIYFDSAYLVKFYLNEAGHDRIVALAEEAGAVGSSLMARGETVLAFHRKWREGALAAGGFREVIAQFEEDCDAGLWTFYPLPDSLFAVLATECTRMPRSVFLRTADAIHLVTARQQGFRSIYSSDRHLLAAAPHFGLRGLDILAQPGHPDEP